jgi:hypothetical protein
MLREQLWALAKRTQGENSQLRVFPGPGIRDLLRYVALHRILTRTFTGCLSIMRNLERYFGSGNFK